MRLIDADLLDEEVMHLFITITGNQKQHTVVNECKSSFRRMIEEQPTVEPVRGKWVFNPTFNEYECSNCTSMISLSDDTNAHPNFCPECGADMRKE